MPIRMPNSVVMLVVIMMVIVVIVVVVMPLMFVMRVHPDAT